MLVISTTHVLFVKDIDTALFSAMKDDLDLPDMNEQETDGWITMVWDPTP